MSLWAYQERASPGQRNAMRPRLSAAHSSERFELTTRCSYCPSEMVALAGTQLPTTAFKGMNAHNASLLGCPACGWWSVSSLLAHAPFETHDGGFAELRVIKGVLKNLDVTDLSTPIEELRRYLLARYTDRFDVHPKKYEEIVGGVFADFGFRVRVTSFSGDEGIDIFVLDGNDSATVGVQVKRFRGTISAEEIRSFVGALVLQGLTTGIYVTTSDYQKGARRTATTALERLGVGVTLLDAKRFYEALQITTRASHWYPADPSAPYYQCWKDLNHYLEEWAKPGWDYRSESWLEQAEYVWGSSW